MEKMTLQEVFALFYKHNEENPTTQFGDEKRLTAVVVFKQGPWFNAEYSQVERSYRFSSDNKHFIPGMGGNSIYANCLDGVEKGIRLDWYIHKWEVDYCYLEDETVRFYNMIFKYGQSEVSRGELESLPAPFFTKNVTDEQMRDIVRQTEIETRERLRLNADEIINFEDDRHSRVWWEELEAAVCEKGIPYYEDIDFES
jgi:hypothetical protein